MLEFIIFIVIIVYVLSKVKVSSGVSGTVKNALKSKGYTISTMPILIGNFEYMVATFGADRTLVVVKKTIGKTIWVDQKTILDQKNRLRCNFVIFATQDVEFNQAVKDFFHSNRIELWDGKMLSKYITTPQNNAIASAINNVRENPINNSGIDIRDQLKNNKTSINDSINMASDNEFEDSPIIDGDRRRFSIFNKKITRL